MASEAPIGVCTLQDTGKREISGSVTETDIVNSGTAITLNDVEITLGLDAMINDNTPPGAYRSNNSAYCWVSDDVDTIGINTPVWSVRGVLDLNDSDDAALLPKICDMARTKGYKILAGSYIVKYSSSIITYTSGVNVRIKNITVKSSANNPNIVNYTIEMRQDGDS